MNEDDRLNRDDFLPEDDDAEATPAAYDADAEADDSRPVVIDSGDEPEEASASVTASPSVDDGEARFVEFRRRTVSLEAARTEGGARETLVSDTGAFESLSRETIEADSSEFGDLNRETLEADAITEDDSGYIAPTPLRDGFDDRLRRVRDKRESTGSLQPVQVRASRKLLTPGCLPLLLSMGAIAGGLLVLAFFLPPLDEYNPVMESVRAEAGFTALDSDDTRAESGALAVEVHPGDPGTDFSVALMQVSSAQYLAGDVPDDDNWRCPTPDTLPRFAQVRADVYSIDTDGTAPRRVGLHFPTGGDDLYGWFPARSTWEFIPSQPISDDIRVTDIPVLPACVTAFDVTPSIPVVGVGVDLNQTMDTNAAGMLNRVYAKGLQPTVQGDLRGVLPAGITTDAGYSVYPLITNYAQESAVDVETVAAILQNQESRLTHSINIAAFADAGNYPGVAIDYRDIPDDLRAHFSDFISTLAQALHMKNRVLVVVVPPAEFVEGGGDGLTLQTGAYDWRTLGILADEILLRLPLDPEQYLPNGTVNAMLHYAVGEINRYKLLPGFSMRTVQTGSRIDASVVPSDAAWEAITGIRFNGGTSVAAPGTQLEAALNTPYQTDFAVHDLLQMPYFSYRQDDGDTSAQRTFWFMTPAALQTRLQQIAAWKPGGIALLDFFDAPVQPGISEVLRAYQDGTEADLQAAALMVRWQVFDANGDLVSDETVPAGTPVFYQVSDADVALVFQASLTGAIEAELGEGQVFVSSDASSGD